MLTCVRRAGLRKIHPKCHTRVAPLNDGGILGKAISDITTKIAGTDDAHSSGKVTAVSSGLR